MQHTATNFAIRTLAAMWLAAVLLSSAVGVVEARSPDVERGKAIAERLCARCHSVTPGGDSPVALAPPFRQLPQRYPVEHLAEALAEGIVTGHPDMPQFRFAPAEIDALLGFINSLAPPGGKRK
jgi:mono/diheme cytochrome c family protein